MWAFLHWDLVPCAVHSISQPLSEGASESLSNFICPNLREYLNTSVEDLEGISVRIGRAMLG